MPLNRNAVIRYEFLDKKLSDKRHYYSIRDLWEQCNEYLVEQGMEPVLKRTIELDLHHLEDIPFSADIERFTHEGKNIVRYSDPTFSIFKKKMSDDEKSMLSEALSTIGQFQGLPNFEWLDGMKSALGQKQEGRKIISFSSSNYLEYLKNPNILGELFTIIANKQVIELKYHTFKDATIKSIFFHPYLLKQYNDRWYVIGAADSDGFILNFALDRVDSYEAQPGKAYKDCPADIEERFEDIIGVTLPKNAETTDVILWVANEYYPYVATKPICDDQSEITSIDEIDRLRLEHPNLKEGRFIKLKNMVINHELVNTILSHSFSVAWLYPERFTLGEEETSMKKIAAKIYENYR